MTDLPYALLVLAALLVYREWWHARRATDLERQVQRLTERLSGVRLDAAPTPHRDRHWTPQREAAAAARRAQAAVGKVDSPAVRRAGKIED